MSPIPSTPCPGLARATAVAWLFSTLVVLPAAAQPTVPDAAADGVRGATPTVRLNPFVVTTEKDDGYRATNSISGTRLNSAIRDVPLALEVVTEEFMRDIGASDLREALRYSAGVVLDSQADYGDARPSSADDGEVFDRRGSSGQTASATNTNYKLRGFQTAITLRNGFRRTATTDAVNVARAEVVRGPSALLYGIGNFGGIVNVVTKRPLSAPRYEVAAGFGSDEYYRATLDATGPLGSTDRVTYRLGAAWQERGWWQEFNDQELFFISPTLNVRVTDKTLLNVELETGRERVDGIGFFGIRDKAAGSPTQARNQPYLPLAGKNQKTFRLSGPDTFVETRTDNLLAEATHSFSERLAVNFGLNYSRTDRSSLNIDDQQLRDDDNTAAAQAARGHLWRTWVTQTQGYFSDFPPQTLTRAIVRYFWRDAASVEDRHQYRAEATYSFSVGGTQHTLLLGNTWDRSENRVLGRRTSANPATGATTFLFRAIDDASYFRFGGATDEPGLVPFERFSQHRWNRGHYLVYQGKYFSDRLQTISGVRYDRSDSRRNNFNAITGDPTTVSTPLSGATKEYSPQMGFSYRLSNAVSAYALYSTGIQPVTNVDGAGVPFEPTKATNLEAGLKIEAFNGKVSGTFSLFQIERNDFPRQIWWAPNPAHSTHPFDASRPISYYFTPNPAIVPGLADYSARTFFEADPADRAIIKAHFDALSVKDAPFTWLWDNNPARANHPSMRTGAAVRSDDEAKGFDAQFILAPIPNWQTVVNYAMVKRRITSGANFVKFPAYSEFSIWYADRLGPTDAWGGGSNYSDIQDSSTFLGETNVNKGASLDDTPRHTVSVWTNYRFTDGPLRGFGVGAGVQWFGERDWRAGSSGDGTTFIVNDGDPNSRILDTTTSDAKLNVDLLLSYVRRIDGRDWRFALNVYNLLDDQHRYGEIYNRPRHLRLSASVGF